MAEMYARFDSTGSSFLVRNLVSRVINMVKTGWLRQLTSFINTRFPYIRIRIARHPGGRYPIPFCQSGTGESLLVWGCGNQDPNPIDYDTVCYFPLLLIPLFLFSADMFFLAGDRRSDPPMISPNYVRPDRHSP